MSLESLLELFSGNLYLSCFLLEISPCGYFSLEVSSFEYYFSRKLYFWILVVLLLSTCHPQKLTHTHIISKPLSPHPQSSAHRPETVRTLRSNQVSSRPVHLIYLPL